MPGVLLLLHEVYLIYCYYRYGNDFSPECGTIYWECSAPLAGIGQKSATHSTLYRQRSLAKGTAAPDVP